MRYLTLLFASIFLFSTAVSAQWKKINDIDYVWGPFTIYNLALFSETGDYHTDTRPVMLSLKYMKPVDGRDFAISLARSWSNLGITLPNQDNVVDRLRKIMPNIKQGDLLSYIALEDKGYFILNDTVISEEFNQDFNNAVLAVWLDPRVEIGKALLSKQQKMKEMPKPSIAIPPREEEQQAGSLEKNLTKEEAKSTSAIHDQPKDDSFLIDKKSESSVSSEQQDKLEPSSPSEQPTELEKPKESENESIEALPPGDFILLKEQPLS